MIECVCPLILQYMEANRGKTGQKHWYRHVLKLVETSQEGKVTLLCNQQVQTYKPDTIFPDNKNEHTCQQMLQFQVTEMWEDSKI